MELHIVMKQGIHYSACMGVFSDVEQAKQAARDACAADHDGWHSYLVLPYTLGTPIAQGARHYDNPVLPDAVYEVRQDSGRGQSGPVVEVPTSGDVMHQVANRVSTP